MLQASLRAALQGRRPARTALEPPRATRSMRTPSSELRRHADRDRSAPLRRRRPGLPSQSIQSLAPDPPRVSGTSSAERSGPPAPEPVQQLAPPTTWRPPHRLGERVTETCCDRRGRELLGQVQHEHLEDRPRAPPPPRMDQVGQDADRASAPAAEKPPDRQTHFALGPGHAKHRAVIRTVPHDPQPLRSVGRMAAARASAWAHLIDRREHR